MSFLYDYPKYGRELYVAVQACVCNSHKTRKHAMPFIIQLINVDVDAARVVSH